MDKLNEKDIKRCKQLLNEIQDLFYAINLELNHNDTGYVSRRYLREKMSGINNDIKCFNSILEED